VVWRGRHPRHRNIAASYTGQYPMLAGHVMCGCEHMAQWGSTQHAIGPHGVGDLVGEIRVAALEQVE
jgi:hypothetical protein